MTLHEQYKEDIKPYAKFIKAKFPNMDIIPDVIKQSYLNSIDCMIAMSRKQIKWMKDMNYNEVYIAHFLAQVQDLKEQRKLIANEV